MTSYHSSSVIYNNYSTSTIDYRNRIPCSATPSLCSTTISEDIKTIQIPTCQAEEELSLDNADLWSFNLGNGSPDPNNMTNPNPNSREISSHLPG